jgi:DNA (cytosine-5)-methyltransferase 1
MKIKFLNLYAGLGGNIKLLDNSIFDITSVELNTKIATVLKNTNPSHKIIIADAHQYLLEHYKEYDFVWSSRPCQKHSKMNKATRHNMIRYVDGALFEEIIFLETYFKGNWVVENVVPYYKPYGSPVKIGRHLFWSNFHIEPMLDYPKSPKGMMNLSTVGQKKIMMDWLGIHYEENIYYEGNHCPVQVLRNCVHPKLGEHVVNCALRTTSLFSGVI